MNMQRIGENSMRLEVTTDLKNDVLIVRLNGELDHHSAEHVKAELEKKIETNTFRHMLVSLENLTFMDSSGIGVLIGRYKKLKQHGGQLMLAHVDASIYRIFEMSGLFKIIDVQPTEADALKRLEEIAL
jgi:stage II sporulation protein AA (anti-sigma F factor antagonist)